jgi:photosystem II stability/assembly factor-like uncharacterized protein
MSVLTIGLAMAMLSPQREPQYGNWRSSKIGGGGFIQGVEIAPSDPKRAYAWVDVGGVYRSDDYGRSWRMLQGALPPRQGNQPVRAFSVDPRNADRILVGTGDHWTSAPEGLYLSENGGRSFKKVLTANYPGNSDYRWTGLLLARHPKSPDVILTGSMGSGAFRSTDGGKSWQAAGLEGVCATDVRFDRADPERAWICAQPYDSWLFGKQNAGLKGGFYRSSDGGRSWAKVADESPTEMLQDPVDASRVYGIFGSREIRLTTDGGDTWRPFSEGLPLKTGGGGPSENEFNALADGPDFVLTASTEGTFYRLNTGSSRWEKLPEPKVEETYYGQPWYGAWDGKGWRHYGKALGSITVDRRDPKRWFFTDWYAIWQTTDAGKTWKLSMDGVEVTVLHTLQQDPSNPNLVHLGMADNGYMRSTNGGERFMPGHVNSNMKGISVSPTRPSRVYGVGDPSNGQWLSNTVWLSNDGGRKWSRSPGTGLPAAENRRCNSIAVDPRNPDLVYVAVAGEVGPGKGGVYQSTDGGNSWSWFGKGLREGQPFFQSDIWVVGRELAAGSDGTLVAASREHNLAYRYDPKSGTWTEARRFGSSANDVVADPRQPGVFYLGSDRDGVFKTADGGRSWTQILNRGAQHIALDLGRSGRLAAGTAPGVFVSTDDGRTWKDLSTQLPTRNNGIPAFAGDRLLVGTSGSGVFWMPLGRK